LLSDNYLPAIIPIPKFIVHQSSFQSGNFV